MVNALLFYSVIMTEKCEKFFNLEHRTRILTLSCDFYCMLNKEKAKTLAFNCFSMLVNSFPESMAEVLKVAFKLIRLSSSLN